MSGPVTITSEVLAARDLPDHQGPGTDKHDRGTVLVVGGSAETPGALLLAAVAALRAGAGRIQVAVAEEVAGPLAVALPEARVIGVPVDPSGAFTPDGLEDLRSTMSRADALLVGSGMMDAAAASGPLLTAVDALGSEGRLVVDAAALGALADEPGRLRSVAERTVVMPNPGELAGLIGEDHDFEGDPEGCLDRAVTQLGCTVAIRGEETWIGSPRPERFVERDGPVGLATSGSGDVLAGLLAGFLAGGADPVTASVWAVHTHAEAGHHCADRFGRLGFLARELLEALPEVLRHLRP